ncbi:MAG: cell envelope integrity protein TolA [Alistipes sp.]
MKNTDGTITGTAIGRFSLSTKTASGSITTETIDGICGFKNGYKTFLLDNGGNVQLGYGDQFVRYDAATGKITFGAGVSLNWTNAIQQAKTETLNAAAATAQNKADAALGSAKSYADTKKSEAVNSAAATAQSKADAALNSAKSYADTKKNEAITQAGKDADSKISALTTTLNASIADAKKAGTDARAVADAITSKANTEGWSNKLTYIDANGIFTGKLSANTVSAININASQITAGTIATARLNAAEIRSNIINAAYINGLTCAFVRGTIGGWTIGATTLSNSHILLDSGNKRMVVYGASSGATSGKRVQLYYNSDTDFGFFATDAAGTCLARFGSANQIAGWNIDASRFYKNNIALGADGSITNGSKWKLNNDGSGSIASGNISWNAAGAVTFSAAVSLNWTNAANSALASAKTYADTKKTEAVNAAAADATSKSDAAKELARAMAFGKMLYRDPTFRNGNNSVNVYNNAGNGTVTVTRTGASAPNDSGYVLEIKTTGSASPGFGGFTFYTQTGYKKIFIVRIIAKIPAGRQIAWATNNIGTGGSSKWLTPTAGTGDWCEYIYKVVCGTASFSSTNFFYLTGGAAATAEAPVTWQVAYATVFDVTSSERYTTTIDANGIYTGTLTAAQVNAVAIDAGSIRTGTLSADRIAAGSINSSKLDAASIKANIINTDYINGLTCTFVRGKIGGWTIGADNITAGSVGAVGAMPIQIRSAASGSGYWYNGAYKPLGIVMTWHQNNNAGHVVFGQIAASGSTVKTGFLGIQMMTWDNVEYFCLSANYTKSGAKEIYNRIAGWAFDNSRIWKNNVSLGADGSITNGTRWKLNNDGSASFGSGRSIFNTDGSGQVANGKFKWDAAGNIIAQGGQFKDVTIQGTIRSAFVQNDPSIWIVVGGGTTSEVQTDPVHYDNVVCTQSGGWSENINLQWTLENSGRRICLVNYKWGSTVSTGVMSITAPSGKYFYEDGISKTTLKFSREVIEMIGYGDDKTFFGWIILNRRDLMTTSRYGKFQQILVTGIVTGTTSSASIRYFCFDGSKSVSVSRLGKGMYRIYLPSSWGLSSRYLVMATGIYSTAENTPIYPTVKAIYSYYFDIYTQDDASRNDGSFNFQVISTADWDL